MLQIRRLKTKHDPKIKGGIMEKKLWVAAWLLFLGHACVAWGGPILDTVSKVPSNLATPLGLQSGTVQKLTGIICYDVRSGNPQDCGFDISITGLHQPETTAENNGGHTHDFADHDVGLLSAVVPFTTVPTPFLQGQTNFDTVIVSHRIPEVSGKIDTLLNLRVPPGWVTVSPESCTGDRTSWCFFTTIDVGLPNDVRLPRFMSLPDGPPFYRKARNPDLAHEDAVAFSGTADAIFYLIAIAEKYNELSTKVLGINDMSLVRGGLFDWKASRELAKQFNFTPIIFKKPHDFHRVGATADINKDNGDCTQNFDLYIAVNAIMPSDLVSFFPPRDFPSAGRFLCETTNQNSIHIDLDVAPPPPPSPFQ
jgi:hypothetical protein